MKKDSVITIYDGMAGNFASYNVIFRNDSVLWNYDIYGTKIFAAISFKNSKKANGFAVNPMGKYPFDLIRDDTGK